MVYYNYTVSVFKAARIMCPVQWMHKTDARHRRHNRSSLIFPSVLNTDATINVMISKLPNYVAAAQDVAIAFEEKKKLNAGITTQMSTNWSSAVKKALLVQPSSTAVESFLPTFHSIQRPTRPCAADYLPASSSEKSDLSEVGITVIG